jgi:hypothetical protein
MSTGYIYKSRRKKLSIVQQLEEVRPKQMDGRKKEPEILSLYY